MGNLGAQKAKRNDTPISAKKDIMGGSVAKFQIKNKIPYGIYDLSWDSQ